MSDDIKDLISSLESRLEQEVKIMEKAFSAAQPGAVFGEPVTAGNYTIITASEVAAGGGFGSGFGFGPAKGREGQETAEPKEQAAMGGAGGMGGGGGSSGRPVAIITIGPDGVKVEPVKDMTKIALAALTAWGAMLIALGRMRKARKG